MNNKKFFKLPFKTAQLVFDTIENYEETIAGYNIKIINMNFDTLTFDVEFSDDPEKAKRQLNSIYSGIIAGTIKGLDYKKNENNSSKVLVKT